MQGKPEPNQPATIATDQAAAVQGRVLTALLSIYVWWFAATPDQRFPLVTEIYFERILVVALFIACLANARKGRLSRAGVVLLLLFFAWCELSYALSPYQHFIFAERWQAEYWKIVVFVVLVVFALGDEQLTRRFLLGTAIALFIYQVHSQLDFQRGGSYVYQQGLRRMAGVWSGGGIGAANAWGVLSLITLPFAVQWRDLTASPRWRHVGIVMAVICAASIVYSGTRGALVCAVPYGAVVIWRRYGAVRLMAVGVVLAAIAIAIVPKSYLDRYETLITSPKAEDAMSRDEEIAATSAHARITGLTDGLKLVARRPILGYGPGASARARLEVNRTIVISEGGQLHNLYGQVLAETGLPGTLLFVALLVVIVSGLQRRIRLESSPIAILVRDEIAILFLYGMFAHMLFSWQWALFIALGIVIAGQGSGRGALRDVKLRPQISVPGG